ncbi:MAG: metallophosphoesterase [Cytophagaceae bacterium]|jgi:predicted MPP superfamily phosphohydrolase|nr:metallophosphoesterase [Cytophagaceae bacterium]
MHALSGRFIIIGIIFILFLLLDWYVYQGVKTLGINSSDTTKKWISLIYWGVTVLSLVLLLTLLFVGPDKLGRGFRSFIILFIFGNFFFKLFFTVILLMEDVVRLGRWLVSLVSNPTPSGEGTAIPRSQFISAVGLTLASIPFVSMIYGVLVGAHDYRVRKVKIALKNLPAAFEGFKILQLSDIHSGSFTNPELVEKGVNMAIAQKADVVFFTGDLVNNIADEVGDYKKMFARLKAPMGVYSVLGNHDYGDYVEWPTASAKRDNLDRLIETHKEMGWDILMNEHRILKKGNDQIAVIGIENWGAKGRFPKYGKMKEAVRDMPQVPVKLLLSHDPSHWDAQVIPEYSDVDVMFAGHTHGMQFGVEIAGIKWSPVKYMYEQWGGLYQKGKQFLYVNRGFGYIGFPGRVGMPPEITVVELVRA